LSLQPRQIKRRQLRNSSTPGGEELAPAITIDDFTKIDLRIA
jgi:hypothetical protein